MIFFNQGQKKGLEFLIYLNKEESPEAFILVKWLSEITLLPKKHDLDFLSLYKWPVFKYTDEKFAIIDVELLIDKIYRQFINDFYFDYLKDKELTYQTYKGIIGVFLENHIASEFKEVLGKKSRATFKHTNQLIFGKQRKELCDIYIRHRKNVFIGQVKSTNFTDVQKFQGTSEFYKGDLDRFYQDIGVTQLVQTIEWMYIFNKEIDSNYNKGTRIYPAIILSDKFFETPLMPHVISLEFSKRISEIEHDFKIQPLLVMDVSSVERFKGLNLKKGKRFWQVLWKNRGNSLHPHFNNTLDYLDIKFHKTKEREKIVNFLKLRKKFN